MKYHGHRQVDPRDAQVLRWILADSEGDFGQLWSVAKEVEEAFGFAGWEEVRDKALEILRPLIEREALLLGDPYLTGRGR